MAKCKECENKVELCEDCGQPILNKRPLQFSNDNKHFHNADSKPFREGSGRSTTN